MSKVLERLKKKRSHAVTVGDETFYVRSLTIGELNRSDKLKPEATGFIVGCALCDGAEGAQLIRQNDGEDDKAFGDRVLREIEDVPNETIVLLLQGVSSIGKPVSLETIAKN